MNKNPVSALAYRIGKAQGEWMDQQAIKYIPRWQKFLMDHFKWMWLKSFFGWEYQIIKSFSDTTDPAMVQTVVFKHHGKQISSANFTILMKGAVANVEQTQTGLN